MANYGVTKSHEMNTPLDKLKIKPNGGVSWQTTTTKTHSTTRCCFEPMSKRRKGFPSETRVKRGRRIVHGDKELLEKLGRDDLCPCGSDKRFQELLHEIRSL